MARAACPFTGRETRAKSAKRVGAERHFSASRLKTDEETLTRVSPAPLLRKCEPREPRNITRFLKVAARSARATRERIVNARTSIPIYISLLPLPASVYTFVA